MNFGNANDLQPVQHKANQSEPSLATRKSRSSQSLLSRRLTTMKWVVLIEAINEELGRDIYDHHICRGGWQALAWTFLFDTVLINSFILQAQRQPEWQPLNSQVAWRQCLFDTIINTYATTASSRQLFRAGDTITPKLQHIRVRRKNVSTCLACKGLRFDDARSRSSEQAILQPQSGNTRLRKVPRSRYFCETCNVALCNS